MPTLNQPFKFGYVTLSDGASYKTHTDDPEPFTTLDWLSEELLQLYNIILAHPISSGKEGMLLGNLHLVGPRKWPFLAMVPAGWDILPHTCTPHLKSD